MMHSELNVSDPLRLLVFGAADILLQAVVDKIKNKLSSTSKFVLVGNKLDVGLTNLVRMETRKGKIKKLLSEDQYHGTQIEEISNSSFDVNLMMGLDHLERKSESFVWRHHKLNNVVDSKHYYNIVIDFLTNFLTSNHINLILFFEIPHLFVDTLTYQIAKHLGIETLILTPSIFPNRFFSLHAIGDNGNWSPNLSENKLTEPFLIDSETDPEWAYMKGVKQYRGEQGRLTIRGIFMLLIHLAKTSPTKLIHIGYMFKSLKRMHQIASQLPKWRNPFSHYFDFRHLEYFENLLEFENMEIDLERKFVYFPLQLQPEMTTSSLGGIYSDQLLALEKLANLLPDDCFIYVKENPKQLGQMRGAQFFHRFHRIKNARWLPSFANTHELVKKSEFVAAVTGTVGWEAICKGKKALVFGMPWYRKLPGVFQYNSETTYEEISNYTIDHDELENLTGHLLSRSHAGNITPLKRRITSGGYDLESNANLVAEVVVGLIEGKIETTFV